MRPRWLVLPTAALIPLFAFVVVSHGQTPGRGSPTRGPQGADAIATEAEARALCGTACHAFPPPDLLPRAAWLDTIARMTLIMQGKPEPTGPPGTAARITPLPPEVRRVARFYEQRAPERLKPPTPWPAADPGQFHRRSFALPSGPPFPAVTHVRFIDLDMDGRLEIAATEMRYGYLVAGDPLREDGRLELIGRASSPAKFERFDWDQDGIPDLLVADLGQFLPSDHSDGAVAWMRGQGRLDFTRYFLPGWPRVADVRAGDFNGDGKADLVVAAFGWRKVGKISILENKTTNYARPSLTQHIVDNRPGAIHVIPVHLDDDRRLDFIALISQQFETVVAYFNTGNFKFRQETIYTAPHPNWGSSGIELLDFDKDGDLDVLLAHGDTFDDAIGKPYHGIQWLENRGSYPFVAHDIADLPGVFGIKAGDLTGDGLLDIVACAFTASSDETSDMPALVWLEQVKPGVFERHTLERSSPRHATLDLADMDEDGDLDILVGNFLSADTPNEPWLVVWENRQKNPGASRLR